MARGPMVRGWHSAHPIHLIPGCRQCRRGIQNARWQMHLNTHYGDRFPRLIRAMQFAAVLSRGEAISCIRDYLRGDKWSGEAVNHYGGTLAVIRAAIRVRHATYAKPEST